MMPWYKNSTLQMDDGEMQWLQSKDPSSCAVWEWIKGDSQKRGASTLRQLSVVDMEMVSRMLGIDSPRFSQILQNLKTINWITESNEIRNWDKWQPGRTKTEDAARKRAEYQKKKAHQNPNKQAVSAENAEDSQETFSQILPKPPISPSIREEEIREDKKNKNTLSGEVRGKAQALLHYLNEKADRRFMEVSANLDLIVQRLSEVNGDESGIRTMIDRQCAKWKTDPAMTEYLRPETLFGKKKFQGYYGNRDLPVIPDDPLPQPRSGGAETTWELKTRLDAKVERVKAIEQRGHEDAFGIQLRPEDKDEHRKLKTEIREIKQKLAA